MKTKNTKIISFLTVFFFFISSTSFAYGAEIIGEKENSEEKAELQKENSEKRVEVQKGDSLNTYSRKENGQIIDSFKKQEFKNIFEDGIPIDNDDVKLLNKGSRIKILNTIKGKIEAKRKEINTKRVLVSRKVGSMERALSDLDTSIQKIRKVIIESNMQIVRKKSLIKKSEAKMAELKIKIKKNKTVLLDYITHLYKKGNIIYKGGDIDSLKVIIFNDGSLGDILSDIHFKTIIEIAGKRLIDEHRNYIKTLFLQKNKYNTEITAYNELKKNNIQKKKELQEKKDYRQRILDITKGKESIYKAYIAKKIDLEKRLKEGLIREKGKYDNVKGDILNKYKCNSQPEILPEEASEDEIKLFNTCKDLLKVLDLEAKLEAFSTSTTNILDWPVEPKNGISGYFKDPDYKKALGSSHDAIDIITDQGTEIKAPADGYVIFIEPPVEGGYSYVAIKHSGGFVTVYGHLSKVNVKKFDFVKRGEVFALSGGEVGIAGSGIMTTGPHLHFEVIKDKKPVNPLSYLNNTFLKIEDLPTTRYLYKYKQDYLERFGKAIDEDLLVNGFVIKGETEVDRQKELLSKYAVGGFKNWDTWIEESFDGNIDPTFLMCIGLAETGLGRNMKTKNNVGNIGNTDSGSTYFFNTPRQGIYWMVSTLNNSFLGDYNELSQLSRYGNDTGSIYASSSDHWHNNIVKCMSAVKGRYIFDDYKFRTKK